MPDVDAETTSVDAGPLPRAITDDALSDEVLAVMEKSVAGYVRRLTDELYERLLYSVQDYLIDNVRFNLGERVTGIERQLRIYRYKYPPAVEALRAARDALRRPEVAEWRETALKRVEGALALSPPIQEDDDQ